LKSSAPDLEVISRCPLQSNSPLALTHLSILVWNTANVSFVMVLRWSFTLVFQKILKHSRAKKKLYAHCLGPYMTLICPCILMRWRSMKIDESWDVFTKRLLVVKTFAVSCMKIQDGRTRTPLPSLPTADAHAFIIHARRAVLRLIP